MSRTVQGATLGGDFVVSGTSQLNGRTHVNFEMPAGNGEHAEMAVTVVSKRFRRRPELGDRHRVVLGLEPLEQEDDYGEPQELKVGVPLSLLMRARQELEGEVGEEVERVIGAVRDYLEDEAEA